jgi:hypothetical protein
MKYTKFIGLAALVMAFSACDDIEESDSLPQVNPQLPGVSAENVKVVAGSDTQAPISLTAFNTAEGLINVAKVDTPTDWPDGYTPDVPYMEMSQTQDFAEVARVTTSMGAEGEVMVNPDVWDGVWKEAYGKNPKERTVYLRFPVFATKGTQSVRMGNASTFYGSESVTVTPFDPYGHVVEDAYYVVGSFCNWDLSQAIKMSQSGYDPYDDPNFSATLNVEGAGYEFVVVPASTVAAGTLDAGGYGAEYAGYVAAIDPEASEFLVVAENSAPAAIVIDNTGSYTLKVNIGEETFRVESLPMLYTPGDSNGWNQAASQTLTTGDGYVFTGFAHLNGGFKFTSQKDWNGTNYGPGDKPGTLSTVDKGVNLTVDTDGLYWVRAVIEIPEDATNATADLKKESLTYTTTIIKTLGVIGSATPAGWDAQTNLAPSADFLTWSGVVDMTDGVFKFRMNDDWALNINLGGELDNLTVGGADMNVTAGKYLVTLNLATRPYICTLTPQ